MRSAWERGRWVVAARDTTDAWGGSPVVACFSPCWRAPELRGDAETEADRAGRPDIKCASAFIYACSFNNFLGPPGFLKGFDAPFKNA